MASLLLPLPPPHFSSRATPSRFHNNGRMLDVFQRLTAKEGTYFLPQDLELSNQELSYIVKKAEQWRGFNGERRKVSISPRCSLSCLDNALLLKPLEINWANGCFLNEGMSQKVTDTKIGLCIVGSVTLGGSCRAAALKERLCWGRVSAILKGTLNGSHDGITLFINTMFNLVTVTKILRPRGCIE